MSLPTISPAAAKRLLDAGAMLIDIRGPEENARERIAGASNHPVDRLTGLEGQPQVAIFHCRSGQRTAAHASKLAAAAACEAYMVEGGIEAWKRAGLPVVRDASQPIASISMRVGSKARPLIPIGEPMPPIPMPIIPC